MARRVAPTAVCFWYSSSQGITSWNSKSNSLPRGKIRLIRSHQSCSYTSLTQITVVRTKARLGKAESTKQQRTVQAAGSSPSLCQGGFHRVSQQQTGTRVYCLGTDWPLSPNTGLGSLLEHFWTRKQQIPPVRGFWTCQVSASNITDCLRESFW